MNILYIIIGLFGIFYASCKFVQKQFSLSTLFYEPIYFVDLSWYGKIFFIIEYCYISVFALVISIFLIYLGMK